MAVDPGKIRFQSTVRDGFSHVRWPFACQPPGQQSIADDPLFAVIPPRVVDLDRNALKDDCDIFEIPSLARRGCVRASPGRR